jgi:hypothetical protein
LQATSGRDMEAREPESVGEKGSRHAAEEMTVRTAKETPAVV